MDKATDYPIVEIIWRDAYFQFDSKEASFDDYLVTTVGYLLDMLNGWYSLAAEILPDGEQRAITKIPIETVQSITTVRVVTL